MTARQHSHRSDVHVTPGQCVIPKSGHRFSEEITHKQKA